MSTFYFLEQGAWNDLICIVLVQSLECIGDGTNFAES
jgi:hypothetical protein